MVLTILEVSQKQAYVFGSEKLRENRMRSAEISFATGGAFFEESAKGLYDEAKNMVYSGGGHAVLQFDSRDAAVEFTKAVTEAAFHRFGGLELFAAHMEYDDERTPGENLKALSAVLERKKALRATSLRRISFGVEEEAIGAQERAEVYDPVAAPEGFTFRGSFEEMAGEDNFIAVIHIDGNQMGRRVERIYEKQSSADWQSCRDSLRKFSESIQRDFEAAFTKTVDTVIAALKLKPGTLPIRPVVLAGDDVCFVTMGSIGLECARVFLEALTAAKNSEDGNNYSACAGVAIVHTKYPFRSAYDLAEELCSNAKRFGARIDPNGGVSAVDWHIEFGQLKDSLAELREDYQTDDGCRLELRPMVVAAPDGVDAGARDYGFFRALCRGLQSGRGIPRGKLKELRTAFKQGEVESRFFLHDRDISELLDYAFNAEFRSSDERMRQFGAILTSGESAEREAFRMFEEDGVKRCLYFDAIELADHWTCFEEVEQ